jgi:uncharacterized integral membrane protein
VVGIKAGHGGRPRPPGNRRREGFLRIFVQRKSIRGEALAMKKTVLAAVLALFIVVFAVQNAGTVPVNFLFWHVRCSMALLLIVMLVAGILAGLLISGASLRKKSSALKAAEKQIARMERRMSEQGSGKTIPK